MSSESIMGELRRVLIQKVRIPKAKVSAAEALLHERAVLVPDAWLDRKVSRDRDNDWVLSVAESSESKCLVAGDDDLLSLRDFEASGLFDQATFGNSRAEDLAICNNALQANAVRPICLGLRRRIHCLGPNESTAAPLSVRPLCAIVSLGNPQKP